MFRKKKADTLLPLQAAIRKKIIEPLLVGTAMAILKNDETETEAISGIQSPSSRRACSPMV